MRVRERESESAVLCSSAHAHVHVHESLRGRMEELHRLFLFILVCVQSRNESPTIAGEANVVAHEVSETRFFHPDSALN